MCNKPLVTVTFLSSSGLPGRGLTAGWSSWRVSGCEAASPTLQAGLHPDGEQLADVGPVPLPCPAPGSPRAGGWALCVPAREGWVVSLSVMV